MVSIIHIACVLNQIKYFPPAIFMSVACMWVIADEAASRGRLAAPLSLSRTESGALTAVLSFPWCYIRDPEVCFSVESQSVWHRFTSSLIFLKLAAQHGWKSFSVYFSSPKIYVPASVLAVCALTSSVNNRLTLGSEWYFQSQETQTGHNVSQSTWH